MSAGHSESDGGLDFDLNLAPIIDCFTVLITFMLVSAAFLSLSTIDASVTPLQIAAIDSSPAPEPKTPGIKVALDLKTNGDIEIQVTGDETRTQLVSRTPAGRDTERTLLELKGIRAKWTSLGKLTLLAENDVEYQDVVHVMEHVKSVIPVVMLGGF